MLNVSLVQGGCDQYWTAGSGVCSLERERRGKQRAPIRFRPFVMLLLAIQNGSTISGHIATYQRVQQYFHVCVSTLYEVDKNVGSCAAHTFHHRRSPLTSTIC